MSDLLGTNDSDLLTGTDFDDLILGLNGDDTLDGSSGNDRLIGGRGDDLYYVDSAGDMVIETGGQGIDTVASSISWTLGDHLENLTLLGGADNSGTGNSLQNILIGNIGMNILSGENGNDHLEGREGNDVLLGGGGQDKLDGGSGDDFLNGGQGPDRMFGGTGNDTYIVDDAGDLVIELPNSGIDTVLSYASYHTLWLGTENLELHGDARNGTGNDLNNRITGNQESNNLDGKAGNDTLIGHAGNDRLLGDDGDDLLNGGAGQDTLTGSTGNDTFLFTNLAGGPDKIMDYEGAGSAALDIIQLDQAFFSALGTGALASTHFVAGTRPVALDADDFILYDTFSGALFYDADGSAAGTAVKFATVAGAPALDVSDFQVV